MTETTIAFFEKIRGMQDMCTIQDARYWDLGLKESESPLMKDHDKEVLEIITTDEFIIKMRFMYNPPYHCHFNIYITLPGDLHVDSDDINHLNLNVEVTYYNAYNPRYLKFGWDHGHRGDAKLCVSESSQRSKYVAGPVQIMDEARGFIDVIRTKNNEIKKEKKRIEMTLLGEELMMKACHPQRITKWIEQGFDPF